MAIKILTTNDQAKGAFDGMKILENKPIGFPQDGGNQQPYSNLFYWANAWSDNGGLIGEHPHKMFEIMSFVIEGEIQHYDNKFNRWLSLKKGDAQIIRSGNGITHAEKILAGGRMFQIWFDPNIQQSITKEATYKDYKSADMKYAIENDISIKNYIGKGGPVTMDAEGVIISELTIPVGEHVLSLDAGKIHSYYLIEGGIRLGNYDVNENDFVIVENEKELNIEAKSDAVLFTIAVPQQLTYKTYLELVNN
jgi:redox-sensitive bicupin YhaK (pirin superfamily)